MSPKGPKISNKRQLKLRETLHHMAQTGVIDESVYGCLMEILNPIDLKGRGTSQENAEAGSPQPILCDSETVVLPLASEELAQPDNSVAAVNEMEDEFDIISDRDENEPPIITRSVSTRDKAISPPMEFNVIMRKERGKAKKSKSKSKEDGSEVEGSKRRTDDLGLDNDLHEDLAKQKDGVSRDAGIAADHNQEETDTARGCLFLCCHRCPSMVRIKFSGQVVPQMSVQLDDEYANGIAITVCKSCDSVQQKSTTFSSGWGNERVSDCANKFRELNMSPGLLKGSDVIRAANFVSNNRVRLITTKGHLHFEDRATVLDYTTSGDEIASINVDAVESGDVNEILKPHLIGGFF